MKGKLKCPLCRRYKLRKHFILRRDYKDHKKGDRIRYGMCRKCSNNLRYDGKTEKLARQRIPAYKEIIKVAIAKHSQKLRDDKDPSYRRSINDARTAAKTKAIVRLEKLQGNTCARAGWEGWGKCDYRHANAHGIYFTPDIDHTQHDGRDEPYEDTYRIALIVLRLSDAELRKRFQLLCSKHNKMKYHRESGQWKEDNIRRAETRRHTWELKAGAA